MRTTASRRVYGTRILQSVIALALVCSVLQASSAAPPLPRLSKPAEYERRVGPLLTTSDYRMEYYEDGAADASVLYPYGNQGVYLRPADSVIKLIELKERSLPILIDCLSDGRLTHVVFGGNRITARMPVPVGYVCLDVLMGLVHNKPVSDQECSNDGLGACMKDGFYFRPDDYYLCSDRDCNPRPWILVVQRNWRRMFLAGRLRINNPYDTFPASIYQDLKTRKK